MSRIGQKPVPVPAGVTLEMTDTAITVKGPRGSLDQRLVPTILVTILPTEVTVKPKHVTRQTKALHGLYRQLISNMITGVSEGYTRRLEMKGTGYRAEVSGNDLVLSVGFSHPVRITAPAGISFNVEKNTSIFVEGIDRQLVGETSAKIRQVRKPEPYKGKGIRYSDEVIRLKPGKAAKSASA
ncbi:MAG: 50S ribosomal protein L6 [Patescibacteria group bacterium]